MKRAAFTLIELMISIAILSIMMLYLYNSYASLNIENGLVKKEVKHIIDMQKIKKVLYLDFALAQGKVTVIHKEKNEDFVSFQSKNSLHHRFNPYIAYVLKEKKLYRLESFKKIKDYHFGVDDVFDVDALGEATLFKVYEGSKKSEGQYLIHIDFKNMEDILYKVKVLG